MKQHTAKPDFTITRTGENSFLVQTDTFMSDGSYLADECFLSDDALLPIITVGLIRPGSQVKVSLGPVSLEAVSKLKLGETYTVPKK